MFSDVLTPIDGRTAGALRGRQRGLHQVLVEWRGIRLHSYPVMLFLGLNLGIVAADIAANDSGLASARVLSAIILLTVPGLIGARLLFIATNWHIYRREPRRMWRRSEGGAAMLGGFVLAVAISPALLAALQLPFAAFWDVSTFVMLFWLIFARIGCHLHGCCCGRPASGPWTLSLPDHRGVWCRRVPTQLLEGFCAVVLLLGAAWLWSERPFAGAVFLSTVAAYGLARLALQPLREEQDRWHGLNIQQTLCAGLVIVSLVSLLTLRFLHAHS